MIKLNKIRIFFLTLYIFFYMLYPKIYLFNFISLILIFGYFFGNISNIKKAKICIPYIFVILIFYFIPSLYYGASKSSIFNFIDFFVRISPIIIGLNEINYLKQESNLSSYKKIRIMILMLIIFVSIVNIYYLNINPYFARIMANYNYNVPGLSTIGTFSGGGYFIIYGFIFIICYLFKRIFIDKNQKNKLLYVILMIIVFICVVKANFATAFVMSIASVLILLFVENFRKRGFISLALLVIVIVSVINYKDLINFAVDNLPPNSIISIRLQDAISNNNDSTAYERFELMQNSVKIIKSDFLFGISAKNNHNYYKMSSKAGLHTEWLDFFARYGVVLAVVYYIFIYSAFKKIISSNIDRKLFISSLISIILLGFLNPISNAGCYFIIFIVIPILIKGEEHEKDI